MALETTHLQFPLRDLPQELHGLKAALLSDLHRGPLNSRRYLTRVLAEVNALEPDLVLIPGDFVEPGGYIEDMARLLALLRAPVLGTLGNHDHWAGREKARRLYPLTLLDNTRVFLDHRKRLCHVPPERGLCLAGVEDILYNKPDLGAALAGVPPGMPRVLLSHNPDFAEDPRAAGHRVDLMLSGHTHGGQIRLPWLGAPITCSRYGQKYAAGLVQGPHWPVYVSRGVGNSGLPLRIGVPAEITVVEFVCQASKIELGNGSQSGGILHARDSGLEGAGTHSSRVERT